MGAGIEAALEPGMAGDREDGGRDPDQEDQAEAAGRQLEGHAGGLLPHEQGCSRQLQQHGRRDDEGRSVGVIGGIGRRSALPHLAHQGVVNDLDEPDQPGHEQGCDQLDRQPDRRFEDHVRARAPKRSRMRSAARRPELSAPSIEGLSVWSPQRIGAPGSSKTDGAPAFAGKERGME